ncbi:MalY/PatB family protein [Muricoccus radiodurans]|uniref:MalY/PatB family protein n=1 Tax=Muricoccus radiodurans TaxID=2231721 RepID=UPI003CE739C9
MEWDFDRIIERRGTGSSKWSRYPADVLPLWVADMDFAVAPPILAAIRERLEHPVLGYGVARDALRETIVAHLAEAHGWRIAPEAIVFLPGVEPGFNMALKALLAPGDGVVVQTPAYRPMLAAPGHWGLRRVDAPLVAAADGHRTDMEGFRRALSGARALLFCNPHNPLGKVFARPELEAIAEACLAQEVLIISDEIHGGLALDGRAHVPIASLSPEVARSTVTLMSASKTYNIAGLKTAFAIIPDSALRDRFAASRLGMVDSVNVLGLEATRAALAEGEPWRQALLAYLRANRDHLFDAVRSRLTGLRMHRPEGSFLAWLDCTGVPVADPARFFLDHARVALSDGMEFGEAGHGHVRLNFGCPRAVLDAALDRIEAAIRAG